MKKLSLLFIAVVLAAAAVFGTVFAACGDDTKYTYSVTVYNEDMTTVKDVTVKWSQSGTERASAVTDADGKATAELAAAAYDVNLYDLPEGMACSAATATSSARDINLIIKKAEVNYTVTVNKSDNTPASDVTVTWTANGAIAGTAVTGADGKASKSLVYGNYSVTISNLPDGNVFVGSKQVTGAQPDAVFGLIAGQNIDFTVTVKSEGGLIFKDCTVTAYKGTEAVASSKTNDEGKVTFPLSNEYGYTVKVDKIPDGYTCTPATISAENTTAELILSSKVIGTAPANDKHYVIGDIIHDYEFTTPYEVDGKNITYKISEILKDKQAIVLNFWGTNCSACVLEMPAMEEAYASYKDRVEFLGVSNYMGGDTNAVINSYREANGYTYPMFRDLNDFTSKFALKAWPTNVVIDRYGAIASIEEGALTSVSYWEKLLDKYVGDGYTQTFTPGDDRSGSTVIDMAKPDVTAPEGHYEAVGEAINGTVPEGCSISWFGEPEATAEFTWPFLLKDLEDGTKVLYPSNTGHDSTFSFIYADVKMTAGKIFAFDYRVESEADIDLFYILFDGKVIDTVSGNTDGWKTCYVYLDIVNGTHQLALSYIKDESKDVGFDGAYIKNARFLDDDAIDGLSANFIRPAAYGTPGQNANEYPYYASVVKNGDGYYCVDLSSLVNAQYAGDDNSPLLFANLLYSTNWNSISVFDLISATDETTGEYLQDCRFSYLGKDGDWRELIAQFASLANVSDIRGYIPVNEQLKELLIAFTAHISGDNAHENEWLELCYFYSNYGDAEKVGNPIIGLTEETAIEITESTKVSADLTRNMQPFPVAIYKFTPQTSGIYRVQSLIPEDKAEIYASQVWIYDDASPIDNPICYNGDRLNRDGKNEQNFDVYIYLTEGHKYYVGVAFLMQETGYCDFMVTYTGKQSVTLLAECASGDYTADNESDFKLRYAVDYERDQDGYYRVKYGDGTLGDYIYVDFKYVTHGHINDPLSKVITQYVSDPLDSDIKHFKVFDFRKSIAYAVVDYDENGLEIYNYAIENTSKFDPDHADDYIDYTKKMQEYCDLALANTGDKEGLIKADDELVKILTLFHRLRTDSIINGVIPAALENEWLRFCYYDKTVDANHPV